MSDIPRARLELEDLANRLPATFQTELREIIDSLLYREPPVRKARRKHWGVTPRMKRQILILATLHPDMHQDEIARVVGTNAGRVSEVLNGKR